MLLISLSANSISSISLAYNKKNDIKSYCDAIGLTNTTLMQKAEAEENLDLSLSIWILHIVGKELCLISLLVIETVAC